MVQLPAYIDGAPLSSGLDTFRQRQDSSGDIVQGIRRLGAGVGDFAVARERADIAEEKAAERERNKTDGINDAITRSDFATEWAKKYAALSDNIDPSGKDFVATVEREFDAHVGEYSGRFSGGRARENAALISGMRTQVVNGAINFESKTRLNSLKEITGRDFETIRATMIEAGPDALDRVMKESELKADSLNLAPNVRAAYMKEARRNAEVGALTYRLKTDPSSVISAGDGLFANLPAAGAPDVIKKIAKGGEVSGVDLSLLLATAQIESRFNESARPIGPDGKPLSGARGVFQMIGGPVDTEAQARETGLRYAETMERLERRGIVVTPGKLYMHHNLGEGLASNVLMARPDEKMADVVARTYPTRPEFAAQVLKNNPSLYNGNMTVAQVLASYERKMAEGLDAVKSFVTADGVRTTDDAARERLSSLLGFKIENMGAAELKAMTDLAKSDLAKNGKKENDLELGRAAHAGEIRIDPFNSEQTKRLDKYAAETGVPEAILQGRKEAFDVVRTVVKNANTIPQPYENAMREHILSSNASDPAKAMAYETLAGIMKDNPIAWTASRLPADVKSRVEKYSMMTQGMDSIRSPAEAIKHITNEYGADADANKRAAKELWKANKEEEIKALTFSDVEKVVSKGLVFNAALFDPNNPAADTRKRVLLDQYVDTYKSYREQGKSPEDAKIEALNEVKRAYGVSNVFRGWTERGEITRWPVEGKYSPIDAKKPYAWIEEQGRNLVNIALIKKGYTDLANTGEIGSGKSPASPVEIRLVPTQRTKDEWDAGKLPSYNLMYRNPKTGKIELAVEAWYPNYVDAQEAYDEKFFKGAKASRELSDLKASPEYGFVANRNLDPSARTK